METSEGFLTTIDLTGPIWNRFDIHLKCLVPREIFLLLAIWYLQWLPLLGYSSHIGIDWAAQAEHCSFPYNTAIGSKNYWFSTMELFKVNSVVAIVLVLLYYNTIAANTAFSWNRRDMQSMYMYKKLHTQPKCKFLGSRLHYYSNCSSTFQLRVLLSGDVNPNPGPVTHDCPHDNLEGNHCSQTDSNRLVTDPFLCEFSRRNFTLCHLRNFLMTHG